VIKLSRRTTDRAIDFLIGRKHSRKDRQVKVSFRELKAQIYWPTTDQKVWGSNPCGRTIKVYIESIIYLYVLILSHALD
jgi:hypothetical protein